MYSLVLQARALLEKGAREVNVNFDYQGEILDRTIEDPFDRPKYENQRLTKETEISGANAWGNSDFWHDSGDSQVKPKSHQERMRDVFGNHSE